MAMIGASLSILYKVLELYPTHIENLLTVAADTPECTKVPLLQMGPFQKQFIPAKTFILDFFLYRSISMGSQI